MCTHTRNSELVTWHEGASDWCTQPLSNSSPQTSYMDTHFLQSELQASETAMGLTHNVSPPRVGLTHNNYALVGFSTN